MLWNFTRETKQSRDVGSYNIEYFFGNALPWVAGYSSGSLVFQSYNILIGCLVSRGHNTIQFTYMRSSTNPYSLCQKEKRKKEDSCNSTLVPRMLCLNIFYAFLNSGEKREDYSTNTNSNSKNNGFTFGWQLLTAFLVALFVVSALGLVILFIRRKRRQNSYPGKMRFVSGLL